LNLNWQNDTCYCNFEVEIIIVGNLEILGLVSVISLCSIHDHMGDQGAFSSALNRNNQSNLAGNSPEAKLNMRNSTR